MDTTDDILFGIDSLSWDPSRLPDQKIALNQIYQPSSLPKSSFLLIIARVVSGNRHVRTSYFLLSDQRPSIIDYLIFIFSSILIFSWSIYSLENCRDFFLQSQKKKVVHHLTWYRADEWLNWASLTSPILRIHDWTWSWVKEDQLIHGHERTKYEPQYPRSLNIEDILENINDKSSTKIRWSHFLFKKYRLSVGNVWHASKYSGRRSEIAILKA